MDKDESLKQEPIRGWFTADEFVEMADRRTKEWAKQADIADIIAGELKVSRGTAYDMMREALKEAAPSQEPSKYGSPELQAMIIQRFVAPDKLTRTDGETPEYMDGWNDCRELILKERIK